MSAPADVREVKVVLLGHTGVGKSSIVHRFVTNQFDRQSEPTIGASFLSKVLQVDDRPVKFQIWDTAGQEKYRSLAPMYYRGAQVAIIVYDITRAVTFETLQVWVKELNQYVDNIVIAVVGNKSDLEGQREVDAGKAERYAETIGAVFFETSAKTNSNVYDLFTALSKRLPEPVEDDDDDDRVDPAAATKADKKKGGCCSIM